MGLLQRMLGAVQGLEDGEDSEANMQVAKSVDALSKEHQKNIEAGMKKSPEDVANSFFSKRLKESKNIRLEISFIKKVRGRFKITRMNTTEKLAILSNELEKITLEINGFDRVLRMTSAYETSIADSEHTCEVLRQEVETLLEKITALTTSRELLYKEINRLISAGAKKSIEYTATQDKITNINVQIRELKREIIDKRKGIYEASKFIGPGRQMNDGLERLKGKYPGRQLYQHSGNKQDMLIEGEITLSKLQTAQKKKIDIEREIGQLRERLVRLNVYIDGTYEYTRQLYVMESEASAEEDNSATT